MAKAGMPPFHTLTPELARKLYNNEKLAGQKESVLRVENLSIAGPGGDLGLRIYIPSGKPPLGALVYFHGGGWVIGTLDSFDCLCRTLANRSGCAIVSVDYRLAPENKFPAAIEDAYCAVNWVFEHAKSIGVDPGKIAVGGDSAGGNLAAAVSLMSRDQAVLPLRFQVLVYPPLIYSGNTDSSRLYEEGYFLTSQCMNWFWRHYLQRPEDGLNPYASPLLSEDFRKLPPAFIITAEYDPLRDEGEAYASKLRKIGIPVVCTRYNGMIHGFINFYGAVDQGDAALNQIAMVLRSSFYST